MPGLPKITLARLKANPGAPKSSPPPLGPDAFQGTDHPDANLLAAFVEKTLTEKERTQVMNHLVECAECREVAALAAPAEVAAPEPHPVAVGRRWNPWLILRWGAMAAVLGALTVVVVLHPGRWKRPAEIAKETPPPVPAGNSPSAPPTVSALPSAPPPPETVQAKARVEARQSAGDVVATRKAPGPPQDQALGNQVARAQAKQQATFMALSRQTAAVRAAHIPPVNAEQEEKKGGSELAVGALAAPTPPPAPAAVPTADETGKLSLESQASRETLRATTQSVTVAGESASAATAEAATAKPAPRVAAPTTYRLMTQAPLSAMRASRKDKGVETGPPAALWSVASDGKVQRSTDGGKTFGQVDVAQGIKFRAIAAIGNEVWTGGTGGALFYSADGGATWNRAAISFEGNAVTETIAAIQLHDPQHLTVTTASGSQWVSEDGGQHWQKQP